MLLKLSSRGLRPLGEVSPGSFVARVAEHEGGEPEREIFLSDSPVRAATGYRAYFYRGRPSDGREKRDAFVLGSEHSYLREGDVVRVEPGSGTVTALYRRNTFSNTFLVTERCDNYCVMCSQPPKDRIDDWLVDDLRTAIPLIDQGAGEIGITGGEPALLGERLVALVGDLARHLPRTAVHVLSNGRRFADRGFASELGRVRHPDLMLGVPLYSDLADGHDFVVQARGAFDETIRGILNLKRAGVRVELRIVIHAQTYERLPELAEFISRNLTLVDHVALMGLELMGFARSNLEALWIDPLDYSAQLVEATRILDRAAMNVSIYNHQLCVLPSAVHSFARMSISDWKNAYHAECACCSVRDSCGGFFASADLRRSRGIAAV